MSLKRLLEFSETHAMQSVPWSRERYNRVMPGLVRWAINVGVTFEPGDFDAVGHNEDYYALAVASGNKSAAKAFEADVKRPAFIADDVDPPTRYDGYHHMQSRRARERLTVDSRFPYRGQTLTVTSFASDGSYLTACSYEVKSAGEDCPTCGCCTRSAKKKIKSRVKITRVDIQADRAERKERVALKDRIMAILKEPTAPKRWVKRRLKIETMEEFDALPIDTIREAVEELEATRD